MGTSWQKLAHAPLGPCHARGLEGDPKVILLVTFVDWAKRFFFVTERLTQDGHTDMTVKIVARLWALLSTRSTTLLGDYAMAQPAFIKPNYFFCDK